MERITRFVDVLLPLPLPGYFTYRVPFVWNEEVEVGKRVVVQFGKKKVYTALIRTLHENVPQKYQPKYILSVLDEKPIIHEKQFLFWEWIASYYLSSAGEVMNVALPQGLKLVSESKIALSPEFDPDKTALTEKEYLLAESLLHQHKLTITQVSRITGLQKTFPLIKTMIDKKIIVVEEELSEAYKQKKESWVRLAAEYTNSGEKLREVFEDLNKRAFKQLQVLMVLINFTQNLSSKSEGMLKASLLQNAHASPAQIQALEKKGILEIYTKTGSRLPQSTASHKADSINLSQEQQVAFASIKNNFAEKDVVLLHGVTSSGKTEIYIKLIEETLQKGEQVLYLLPEIALTTQIIVRLQKYFGDKIGVYHSKYNKHEKVEIWNKVLCQDSPADSLSYQVILGPRSALFLPYKKLGLIIVDEEHDHSYKQFDPAPRYHARDSAIYLATLQHAKVLLGSATPSIESYYNAQKNKYTLVELSKRYQGIQLPEIFVADIKTESRRKTMRSHFSSLLLQHVEEALKNKEQVILFQNRRGFSLHIACDLCNYIPQCVQCDVSLTYHKSSNHLRCHYCGFSAKIPAECPSCKNPKILMKGFGTEKVEEELSLIYPKAIIRRMDLDTTRSKTAYQKIIESFEKKEIDILVGTQMVTKGLDFDNVSVVGILNADNLLNFPDFRSHERSFQLMAQVSGRAGRKNKRGRVVIQSYNPYHSVIREVIDNAYVKFYKESIVERLNFKYPPFYKLIEIELKHRDYHLLNKASDELAGMLRAKFGQRVLGPEYPLVSRIKNLFIKNILLKIERNNAQAKAKTILSEILDSFHKKHSYKSIRIHIDVDPQ